MHEDKNSYPIRLKQHTVDEDSMERFTVIEIQCTTLCRRLAVGKL